MVGSYQNVINYFCFLKQTNILRVGLVPIAGVIEWKAAKSVDEGSILDLDIEEHTWLKWKSLWGWLVD